MNKQTHTATEGAMRIVNELLAYIDENKEQLGKEHCYIQMIYEHPEKDGSTKLGCRSHYPIGDLAFALYQVMYKTPAFRDCIDLALKCFEEPTD